MREREEMAYIAQAQQSCSRYGFKPDTDAFAQCVNANVNAAKDRDAVRQQAMMSDGKK
jgi:hypothetical protein